MLQTFATEVVSSHDQHGKSCALARDLLFLLSAPNQVSGNMAGSTTRLPLPNSTSGRHWYLLSRPLLTRLTCALILAQLPARAACPRSGRLKSRAQAPERTLARVCREAGATVRFNGMLRDMNVTVAATDHRGIEVFASGLPLQRSME